MSTADPGSTPRTSAPRPALRMERGGSAERGTEELKLFGRLGLESGDEIWRVLHDPLLDSAQRLRLDLSGVEAADGGGAAMLLAAREEIRGRGGELELVGARADLERLLELYALDASHKRPPDPARPHGLLESVGHATAGLGHSLREVFGFLGDLVISVLASVRAPRSVQWRDIPRLAERSGADGVPIVLLINFLIGGIIALQASYQLARFGADVFVADLVGLALTRELAPLMTAIIVAGRSGAAFAAELGTMRVSEEIDALEVMGIDPMRHLVFPRAIALALAVPLLTIGADVIGCLGGLVVALFQLGLEPGVYLTQLQAAVGFWDVAGGLIKSVVFAVTITLISCQRGLATRGGAAGVGASTTSAVVAILFALIVWDAIFTSLFNTLGI